MATLPAVPAHIETTPRHGGVRDLQPIEVFAIDRTSWDPVWDRLMRTYHHLGHRRLLSARVKHLVFSRDRPIAALRLEMRDRFTGAEAASSTAGGQQWPPAAFALGPPSPCGFPRACP
ncbi:MAG: hypothetical protein AB1445_07830 [Bacillota bacterium]